MGLDDVPVHLRVILGFQHHIAGEFISTSIHLFKGNLSGCKVVKILTRLFFLNISWANMDIFAYLVLTFLGFKVVHLVRRLFNSGAFKKMAEISAEVGGGLLSSWMRELRWKNLC